MKQKLANGMMFNVSWFLIVWTHSAVLAWLIAAVHVAVHMATLGRGRGEWTLLALAAAVGLVIDQLLFALGILNADGGPAPLWLSALWPVFATTMLHAFSGLRSLPWLAALVGGIGGYLSYRAGAALSSVSLGASPVADIALVLLWALLFPTLLVLAARLEAMAQEAPRAA